MPEPKLTPDQIADRAFEDMRSVAQASMNVGAKIPAEQALKAIDLSGRTGVSLEQAIRDTTLLPRNSEGFNRFEELFGSPALRERILDPTRAASIRESAGDWIDVRAAMAETPPLGSDLAYRFERGRSIVRGGELIRGRLRGTLSEAEREEFDHLPARGGEDPDMARRLGLVRPFFDEVADFFLGFAQRLSPVGELVPRVGEEAGQPRGLARRALGSAAEQTPIMANVLPRAGAGAVVGAAPGAGVVAIGGLTGNPALIALGSELAGAGATAGGGVGAFSAAFDMELYGSFTEFSALTDAAGNPLPEELVVGSALVAATIKGGLEVVSLRALLRVVPSLKDFFAGSAKEATAALAANPAARSLVAELGRDYLKAIATETSTESLQEIADVVIGARALKVASGEQFGVGDALDAAGDDWERIVDAGVEAGLATAVFGTAGAGGRIVVHEAGRVRAAAQNRERLARVQAAFGALAGHREAAPDDFAALAQALGIESNLAEVAIPADKLVELFQGAEDAQNRPQASEAAEGGGEQAAEISIDDLPAVVRDQIAPALAAGSDVVIPTGVWARDIAPHLGDRALEHLRLAPGDPTPFEAEALEARVQGQADEIVAESEALDREAGLPMARAALAHRVKERLVASKIYPEEEAGHIAALVAANVAVEAADRQVPLEQVLAERGTLEFLSPEQAVRARSQGGFAFGTTEDVLAAPGEPGKVFGFAPDKSAGADLSGGAAPAELAQSVALRTGKETLAEFGAPPGGRYTRRQLAKALERRTRKLFGKTDRKDRSPRASRRIAAWMTQEILHELRLPESESAVGWYSVRFQRALSRLAVLFPELAERQPARDLMTALIAITSDGARPVDNLDAAVGIYGRWRATGRFTPDKGTMRQASVDSNLKRLQLIADTHEENFAKHLLEELTVADLNRERRKAGLDAMGDFQAHLRVPRAALYFGPKLGFFYANLMGQSGYLTMDRWWSRTFNRYRGQLLKKPTPEGIARVRQLLRQPGLSDREVVEATDAIHDRYEAKGYKRGTALERAANTVWKAAFSELEDVPFNATDRTFMVETVRRAQASLLRRGYDLTVADIQAILWYYEKRLYRELGSKDSSDVSFEEAVPLVLARRGGRSAGSDVEGARAAGRPADRGAPADEPVPLATAVGEGAREPADVELFAGPAPAREDYALEDEDARPEVREAAEPVPIALEVFDAEPAPAEEILPNAPQIELVQTGRFPVGLTTVTTVEEAAHVIAPIRKQAHESLMAIVTGRRGKVLRVVRVSTGTMNESLAAPVPTLAPLFSVPKARNVWLAHNHPTGVPMPSAEDRAMTRRMAEILRGTQLNLAGSFVVAPGQAVGATIDLDGDSRSFKIRPAARTDEVAVLERRMKRVPKPAVAVRDEQSAILWWREQGRGRDGLLVLDTRHRPVAFVAMNVNQMQQLRTAKETSGVARMMRVLDKTNGVALLAFVQGDRQAQGVTQNLSGFGNAVGAHLLDVIDPVARRSLRAEGLYVPGQRSEFFQAREPADAAAERELDRLAEGAPDFVTPEELDEAWGYMLDRDETLAQRQRGSIVFSDAALRRAAITFTESRDLSTPIHELGHYFLRDLLRRAAMRDATPRSRADAVSALRAIGAASAADRLERRAPLELVVAEISREADERFADAFLAYAREGRAPSEDLRSAMAAFRAWLVAIYQSVKQLLGGRQLNEELRQVMDRLVATDEEIARARGTDELLAKIAAAEDLGVSPEEFERLETLRRRALEGATAKLDAAQLRRVERMRGLFTKVATERERMRREQRADLEAAVEQELGAQGVWKADHFLRTGALLGAPEDAPAPPAVKLSREAILRMFGNTPYAEAVRKWTTGPNTLVRVDGGVHPDEIAQQFGFGTGLELVRALVDAGAGDAQAFQRAVAAEVEKRYRAAEALPAGELEARAIAEISHSERKVEFLIAELRALERRSGTEETPRQALELAAARIIARRQVMQLRPDLYRHAAKRARRAAMDAVRTGDFAKAAAETRKEVFNTILDRQASDARDEADAFHGLAKRLDTDTKLRERIGKAGHGYLEQIDAVLERFALSGSMRGVARKQALVRWADEERALGRSVLLTPELEDEGRRQHWRTFTVEELRGVAASLESLRVQALDALETKVGNQLIEREILAEHLIAELKAGVLRRATRSPMAGAGTPLDRAFARARALDASLAQVEPLVNALVHGDPRSWWHRAILAPLFEAMGVYDDATRVYTEKVQAAYDRFEKKTQKAYQEVVSEDRLIDPLTRQPMRFTKWHLIALALNVGNESNFEKLVGGYGWNAQQVRDVLNDHLSDEDWAFVQELWDLVEDLWPAFAALEKDVVGVEPEKLRRVPFATRSGKILAGGYWPVLYDPTRSRTAASNEAHAVFAARESGFGSAVTRSGSAISRTAVELPILLDVGRVLTKHLDEVLLDLAFRKPLLEAAKLLSHRGLDETMRLELGDEYTYAKFWLPWLQSIAGDRMSGATLKFWEELFRTARLHASVFKLGFRASTLIAQASGLSNAVQTLYENTPEGVSRVEIAKVLADSFASSFGFLNLRKMNRVRAQVEQQSAFMRGRVKSLDRDLRDIVRLAQATSRKDLEIAQFAMKCIALTQLHTVDLPVWLAAQRLALEHHGLDAKEAVAFADRAVRLSQGAGSRLSQSAFQAQSGEVLKSFGVFYSYQNTVLNQMRQNWRANHSIPSLLAAYWWNLAAPGMWATAAGLVALGLEGREPDEKWWARRAREIFGASIFGLVPLLRDIYPMFAGDQPRTGSVIEPWVQTIDRATNADEPAEAFFRWARVVGLAAGAPVDWPLSVAEHWLADEDK